MNHSNTIEQQAPPLPPASDTAPVSSAGRGTQTLAMLLDAYRDLQSRKLFWLTLVLSVLVAVMFAGVGINERGVTIFGKLFPGAYNSLLVSPADLFKLIFTTFGVQVWLGFLATVLALVAVGGIFPDMISTGSIDLYLSRPISRLRLFLTKYAFGLLFTALQVFLFCIASFFVIGIRGGAWEWRIFLAVPLVTLFFSYLYCVCVMVGIATRSALAAILLTAIFWGGLYAIHNLDLLLNAFTFAADERVATEQRRVAMNQEQIDKNNALPPERRGNMTAWEYQRDAARASLGDFQQTADRFHWWANLVVGVETPLPKTNETVALMGRWLVRPGAFTAAEDQQRARREQWRQQHGRGGGPPTTNQRQDLHQFVESPAVEDRIERELGARDLPWVVGTSLGFEIVVLSLAAWLFCRRDY